MKTALTLSDIEALVETEEYFQPVETTMTICVLKLKNGCVARGDSNVIDPTRFDAELGRKYARASAIDQIWQLEGYAIKRDLHRASEAIPNMQTL